MKKKYSEIINPPKEKIEILKPKEINDRVVANLKVILKSQRF